MNNNEEIKNIIFIIADTLRAKSVGLYGTRPSPTPMIDMHGRRGIVFTNAYTSITKTDSSITAIMTGMYPMSNGLISHGRWIIKRQEEALRKIPFLAETLQKNGFKTAAIDFFGKWHRRGFSYYSGKLIKDVNEKKLTSHNIPILEHLRVLDGLSLRFLKRDFFVRFYYCFFPRVVVPYDPADVVVDRAISVLEKHKNKKLFLYIHFRDPHSPNTRPATLRSYFFDSIEDRYNAEVNFMDEQIGRLVEHLEKTQELENTLIVFTADHGESLTEHNIYIAHHDPYEVVVRVPLIFYNCGFRPKKIASLVQNIDIFPTILEILGIDQPPSVDCISLLPLVKGIVKKTRDFVFFDDNLFGETMIKKSRRKLGIRFKNYKYIKTIQGKDGDLFQPVPINAKVVKEELYDLSEDPDEMNNLNRRKGDILVKLQNILQVQIETLAKNNVKI